MKAGRLCRPLGAVLLWGALALPAAADPFARALAGDWLGRGTIAPDIAAPGRRGQCQVVVPSSDAAGEFRMEGTCAVAGGRSQFILRVIRLDGTRLEAGFRVQGSEGTAQLVGTYRSDRIALYSGEPFELDGVRYLSRLSIFFRDANSFTVDQWIWPEGADAQRHVVSLSFERRQARG